MPSNTLLDADPETGGGDSSEPIQEGTPELEIRHPGLGWLDLMACADLDERALAEQAAARAAAAAAGDPVPTGDPPGALGQFFVDAGHVISETTLRTCRQKCPVRRECIIHAYLGGMGGATINGGYLGGFSLGQRKAMTLEQALEQAERDQPGADA